MHPLRRTRSRERLASTRVASSVRSITSKFMWILIAALCAAPLASAEIFKCAGKNGTDLYQNFPCQFDSLGSLPSSPPSAKTTLPPGEASQVKAKPAPVDVASSAKSANAREPRMGMTPDEVRAIWGEPVEAVQDEPREGRIEIWRYGETRSVQFNHKQRVVAVQR
jgi:hypothetical protein